MTRTYTHKGWLGLAPIYLNIDTPQLEARHWAFEYLLDFSILAMGVMEELTGNEMRARVTGELVPPKVID